MWGKLYRKSSLNAANIQPTGITTGEDLAFNLQLFPYLSKIYILKECGYNYRFGGMTTRYNTCLLPDLKKLYYIKKAFREISGSYKLYFFTESRLSKF